MIRSLLCRTGILALALALIGPMALAQSQTDDPADDTSPEEVEQVAEVLLRIEKVRHKYQEKIRTAGNDQKIQAHQRQMAVDIEKVIEEYDGLTTERYEEITRAANENTELKQKILSLVEEKRQEQVSR